MNKMTQKLSQDAHVLSELKLLLKLLSQNTQGFFAVFSPFYFRTGETTTSKCNNTVKELEKL